jgi:phage baseplate assembly protein W|tara:strand:+ start:135 stop:563 length:429 start_codon:yes stop_codon:yes gene_type:complete
MANYDATSTNRSKRSVRIFSDLNLNFTRNPATKDVAKLYDIEAVKRSVRNLINTNEGERPFQPTLGSGIRALLFENMTPIIETLLKDRIAETINVYEPRALLTSILVQGDIDRNEYLCTISFRVVNTTADPVTITEFLQRLR